MHVAREAMLEHTAGTTRVPLCIVRPCAVYGPGDTHNSYGPNRFVRSAYTTGKIELFGNGEEERDHIYVRDVSDFLMLCLRHTLQGIINITTGNAVSFLDLAQWIARSCPKQIVIEHLPRRVPVSHRRFDPGLRRKWFPEFEPRSLEVGLKQMIRDVFDRKH